MGPNPSPGFSQTNEALDRDLTDAVHELLQHLNSGVGVGFAG